MKKYTGEGVSLFIQQKMGRYHKEQKLNLVDGERFLWTCIYIPMLTSSRQQHSLTADEDRFWSQKGNLLNGQHSESAESTEKGRTCLGMRWYLQELWSLHLVSSAPLGDTLALSSFRKTKEDNIL